jgi:hypothetical protein
MASEAVAHIAIPPMAGRNDFFLVSAATSTIAQFMYHKGAASETAVDKTVGL